MADTTYTSPGGAFEQGFQGMLLQQAQQKRQAMLDQITMEREKRLAKSDDLEIQVRQDQLRQKQVEDLQKQAESFVKNYRTTHVAGDIPSAEDRKKAAELGVEQELFKTIEGQTLPSVQMAGAMRLPGGAPTGPQMAPPAPAEALAPAPQTPLPAPSLRLAMPQREPELDKTLYPGTAAEQGKIEQEKRLKGLTDMIEAGAKPAEILSAGLAAGIDPKTLDGLITAVKPKTPTIPELGTFGDYVARRFGPNPTAAQIEQARKTYGDEGRAPEKGDPTQLVPEVDPKTGQQTGRYFAYDGRSKKFDLISGGPTGTKANAGAAQANQKKTTVDAAFSQTDRLKSDIDEANRLGLLGPASGREYNLFARVGTTGNPEKDHLIGRLKGDLLLTKMLIDSGIGGTRAASSPLLLKNWEDLALSGSKDLLLGYVSAIQDELKPPTAPEGGSPNSKPPDLIWDSATKTFKRP